jgi:AcrR family transcriptional regulator
MAAGERIEQKQRTRQDLLRAAARLMKSGRVPKLVEVAEEAGISRATAYRYFSSDEALLTEAPVNSLVPTTEEVFAGDSSLDPEERLLKANSAMRGFVWGNAVVFRMILARLLEQAARKPEGASAEPARQNRRGAYIRAALEPVRDQFDDAVYEKLCAALSLVIGTESMVVFQDVLQMTDADACEVESWVICVLTQAALAESTQKENKEHAE